MVLIYDDFQHDNEVTLRTVLRFLDLSDMSLAGVREVNPTVRVRSRRLNHLIFRERGLLWRAMRAGARLFVRRQTRSRVLDVTRRHIVYGAPRPPDEELMMELRHRFKPEVVALSEYLNRDLVALWGYDSID
jgi:hypothetical protein